MHEFSFLAISTPIGGKIESHSRKKRLVKTECVFFVTKIPYFFRLNVVIVTVTMVSTATMAPVIQDGPAPITYTALKISSAIPTCKSVGRGYEGALTNNSAGQETSARVGCVQSGSAVCTKTALGTTLANRESVRSTRVTVMRDTTTTANTDMLASTVGVFFVQVANFNFYLRV